MKKFIILLILLTAGLSIVNAQQRDLDFYLGQARLNSPLINRSKNENEIVRLDLQQVKSILSKPEVNLVSGIMFAPIVSHDVSPGRFEWVSNGASSYTGYDLAVTDGGQYQAQVSITQPLLSGSRLKTYENKATVSGRINTWEALLPAQYLKKNNLRISGSYHL
ncbi:MAG: hypothetical protein WCE64_07425 [Bacteroidales bacterium]